MTSETTSGRELVQLFELVQPFCEHRFGVAPCTATGGSADKCYGTFSTCDDPENYSASTLSIFFSKGGVGSRGIEGVPYIIPTLRSVSTQPAQINIAVAGRNSEALGFRGECVAEFDDDIGTDRGVDPYVDERPWDTSKGGRGTRWLRWLARNEYKQNIQFNVYEGYVGQALSEMVKKTYFVENVDMPGDGKRVRLVGYDPLYRLNEQGAMAPKASPGVLRVAISAVQTSLSVVGADEADYPASGTLRIDDEILTYSARTYNGKSLEFTGLERGTDKSTAAAHDFDTTVQECLRYTDASIDDIVADLVENYVGVKAAWLDKSGWATEVDTYLSLWPVTNLITVPTRVKNHLNELQEQFGFNIFWHDRDALVKLRVLRGLDSDPPLLSGKKGIVSGSYSMKERPEERVSELVVHHSPKDYTSDRGDASIYETSVWKNPDSEGEDAHGSAAVREIFGNWLAGSYATELVNDKILTKYVNVPRDIKVQVDAKDRSKWLGDVVKLDHHREIDKHGERNIRTWLIASAEEVIPGHRAEYILKEITVYGVINFIMPDGSADYVPGGPNPEKNCFIGFDDGLLSDGEPCGVFAI